jgi:hypothetical protein
MRFKYFDDKRRALTKQVEETIREGIIEEVRKEFPQGS